MKIGITIGDNDYQRTIQAFLRLFHDSAVSCDAEYCHHGLLRGSCDLPRCYATFEPITKDRIIFLWDRLKLGLYLMAQRGFRTHACNPSLQEDIASVEQYLTIRPHNIFLDDEVAAYINAPTDNFNYEFSWVDTLTGVVTTR